MQMLNLFDGINQQLREYYIKIIYHINQNDGNRNHYKWHRYDLACNLGCKIMMSRYDMIKIVFHITQSSDVLRPIYINSESLIYKHLAIKAFHNIFIKSTEWFGEYQVVIW